MTQQLKFSVSLKSFDKEAHDAIQKAEAEIVRIKNELIGKFVTSDRFKAACDLAGEHQYGGKKSPHVHITGGEIVVVVSSDEATSDPAKTPPSQLYLDPKLTNSLLHGKILTDDEKRRLVARLAPGVMNEAEGGAA